LLSHRHIAIEINIPTQKVASLHCHMMVKLSVYLKKISMKNCFIF